MKLLITQVTKKVRKYFNDQFETLHKLQWTLVELTQLQINRCVMLSKLIHIQIMNACNPNYVMRHCFF